MQTRTPSIKTPTNSYSAHALAGQFALARPFPGLLGPTISFAPENDGGAADPAADPEATPAPAADPNPAPEPAPAEGDPAPAADPAPDADLTGDEGDDLLGGNPDKVGEEPPAEAANDEAAAEIDFDAIKPPEGFESLDAEALKAAAPVLAELGIDLKDTAKVQGIVDLYAMHGAQLVEKAFAQAIEAHQAKITGWKTELRADPEFKTTDAFKTGMAAATRTLGKFFDPGLVADLKESGLANHPALIKGLKAIDAAIGEDVTLPPNAAANEKVDPAHRMYPEFAPGARQRA